MKKKEGSRFFSRLNQRKYRYGRFAVFLTVVVFAIVILLNVAVGRLEQTQAWAVDLNGLNATEFDQSTLDVLKLVDEDVYVYTVYQASTENALRVQVDAILEKYHALKQNFSRVERGCPWPAFWKSEGFRQRVAFRRVYHLAQPTSFRALGIDGSLGYVQLDDEKHQLGEQIFCAPGTHRICIHLACIAAMPAVYECTIYCYIMCGHHFWYLAPAREFASVLCRLRLWNNCCTIFILHGFIHLAINHIRNSILVDIKRTCHGHVVGWHYIG